MSRKGAAGAGRGSGQGRGQEQAGSRIPVSVLHYNNSGSAAENGPGVLADAAELLMWWQRVQRGEAAIFVDVEIPVVPSMCIVLLRCCCTAKLLWELLWGSQTLFPCPLGLGVSSRCQGAGMLWGSSLRW